MTNNVLAADDQQERLDANWVVGFVDGEGCFHVSINRQPKMTTGWQVLPEFRVVQHKKSESVLFRMQQFFGAGTVVGNHGWRRELRIRKLDDLRRVVAFFEKYPLQTKKQEDFALFRQTIASMEKKEHLTKEGLTKIAQISWKMNKKVKPRYLA